MDYKEKYEMALKKAEALIAGETNTSDALFYLNDIKSIFPELQESEDEQHRKWILEYLYDGLRKSDEQFKDQFKSAIAWLEKQSGQKPFGYENANIQQNDFAPKFKLGDWIVWKDKCYKVNDNGCGYELIDTNGLSTSLEYGTVDENARLWTITDAKDGDILSTYECIVVFKEINWLNIRCYCAYHYLNHQAFYVDTLQSKTAFHPATKEQRDLLFKKMEEDGYEFDFNKKELKKTPKDSLGISSEKYNEIVNECIFGDDEKSKWTEEDEKYIDNCCLLIGAADDCYEKPFKDDCILYLQSLKERIAWKPMPIKQKDIDDLVFDFKWSSENFKNKRVTDIYRQGIYDVMELLKQRMEQ